MKIIGALVLVAFLLNSCKEHKASKGIVIEGQVKNIPDGKIYLTEAHYWRIPLDSAMCTNGHFTFRINTDSSFMPYMASIRFADNSSPYKDKVGFLVFRNYALGADSLKHFRTAFYLEGGHTKITGDYKDGMGVRIFAGRENDVMFKNEFTSFGWLGNIDSIKRLKRIGFFKREVKRNSFSYFLARSIYDAKEQYSEEELNGLLSFFDADVQESKLGDDFRRYLSNRTDSGKPHLNLSLLDSTDQKHPMVDNKARLTMLVFWASWCGPCRMEIPMIKDVQKQYGGRGLNVVNVSINDSKARWIGALKQEKMPWSQYMADKEQSALIRQQFNFTGIPQIVFVDNNSQEIARFTGYDESRKADYEAVINKYVN